MSTRDPRLDEVARRGQALYEEKLRAALEPGNRGRFLVLDIVTGDYEMDSDELAAIDRAEERMPGSELFLLRIGFAAAYDVLGATPGPP